MSIQRKRILFLLLTVLLGSLVGTGIYFYSHTHVNSSPLQTQGSVDLLAQQKTMQTYLHDAPWVGLRYLPELKEWRFYALTGESRQIELVHSFDLVKLYYLRADGGLSFTWAATSVDRTSPQNVILTSRPLLPGTLVAVSLKGDNVSPIGVNWEDCDSFYCRVANAVDGILILDDQGTGISNGFIRYGWEPPSFPMYGFLCWWLEPVEDPLPLISIPQGENK